MTKTKTNGTTKINRPSAHATISCPKTKQETTTMSKWQNLMKKFDNALLREQVVDLQRNPYLLAEASTGEPEDHPKTRIAAKKFCKEYVDRCRCNAYVFGDTFEGMDAEDAIKIICEQEFSPAGRTPEGHIRFHHDHLAMGLTPRLDANGKLAIIAGTMALRVNPESTCGLGLSNADMMEDTLHADIDLTGGMKVKMFILRSWVSAAVNA